RCHFIKGVVSNFVVVGKLRIQQRITLGNLQWVGSLDVRIQELKRWSLNPTVIGQLDHISVVQLPAYIQTWHQGTISWNLSSLLAPEVSINMRIFISKSPFDGVIFQKAKSIGQVTGCDILLIIKFIGELYIIQLFIGSVSTICHKIRIITIGSSHDVFGTIFQNLLIASTYRCYIIQLDRKFLVIAGIVVLCSADNGFKVVIKQTVHKVIGSVVTAVQAKDAEFLAFSFIGSGIIEVHINVIGQVVHIDLPQQAVD